MNLFSLITPDLVNTKSSVVSVTIQSVTVMGVYTFRTDLGILSASLNSGEKSTTRLGMLRVNSMSVSDPW